MARLLKLVAKFNDSEATTETRIRFADIAGQLIRQAVDYKMPLTLKTAILEESPAILMIEGKTARLVRESWPSGRGHELRFYLASNIHE